MYFFRMRGTVALKIENETTPFFSINDYVIYGLGLSKYFGVRFTHNALVY